MLRRLLILLCAAALLLPLGGLADSIVRLNTPAPPAEGEALASPTPAPSPTPIAAPAEETADAAPADAAPAEETAAAAPAESAPRWSDTQPFGIRHGPREAKRVAITMDDCYERAYVRELFELCQEYGVSCTFFPLGDQLKAADAELWRAIAESPCEIGSHTNHHTKMTNMGYSSICIHLYRTQERLDEVLGYHYGMVSLRPPFGAYKIGERVMPEIQRACNRYGYEHMVLWDVSQTDFEQAKKDVQNGSILLYHARKKDMACLRKLIPWLIGEGYELVTVRELLELPEIQTGPEIYNHLND